MQRSKHFQGFNDDPADFQEEFTQKNARRHFFSENFVIFALLTTEFQLSSPFTVNDLSLTQSTILSTFFARYGGQYRCFKHLVLENVGYHQLLTFWYLQQTGALQKYWVWWSVVVQWEFGECIFLWRLPMDGTKYNYSVRTLLFNRLDCNPSWSKGINCWLCEVSWSTQAFSITFLFGKIFFLSSCY